MILAEPARGASLSGGGSHLGGVGVVIGEDAFEKLAAAEGTAVGARPEGALTHAATLSLLAQLTCRGEGGWSGDRTTGLRV